MIDKYSKIRRFLHQNPELAEKEKATADYVAEYLLDSKPDNIYRNVGGYGIIAVFDSKNKGHTLMFRSELDALPITETNSFSHVSTNKGISHKCGHDGHITILLALADWISANRHKISGKICLLFQPAEETAAGALNILADDRFKKIAPDYIFALHNLPGFKKNSLIIRPNVFASASLGMKFFFTGKTSHAGHPENGNNPLFAMQAFINAIQNIPHRKTKLYEAGLITIIHVNLGEEAFGTSPGNGVVMATLRAYSDIALLKMADEAENMADNLASAYNLSVNTERVEYFAATVNDIEAYDILSKAAAASKLEIIHQHHTFPWTEDFSFYSKKYKTAFFGLGSGYDHPQLHNPDYDFPDDLIETGKKIFSKIIEEVNLNET